MQERETVTFQHPQNSWWSLIMHTGQVSAASKTPLQALYPLGTPEWSPDTHFSHQAHWFPMMSSHNTQPTARALWPPEHGCPPTFHPASAVELGWLGQSDLLIFRRKPDVHRNPTASPAPQALTILTLHRMLWAYPTLPACQSPVLNR